MNTVNFEKYLSKKYENISREIDEMYEKSYIEAGRIQDTTYLYNQQGVLYKKSDPRRNKHTAFADAYWNQEFID